MPNGLEVVKFAPGFFFEGLNVLSDDQSRAVIGKLDGMHFSKRGADIPPGLSALTVGQAIDNITQ